MSTHYGKWSYDKYNANSITTSNKGMTAALGNNFFDYGQMKSTEHLRETWEALVSYAGCKTKEYEDGNDALAWEKLKKKFDPISAPCRLQQEECSENVS
jgi:hypothetical protein